MNVHLSLAKATEATEASPQTQNTCSITELCKILIVAGFAIYHFITLLQM